jgi:hypothetical protein
MTPLGFPSLPACPVVFPSVLLCMVYMFEEERLGDGARCALGSIPEGLEGLAFSHEAARGFC